MTTSRLLCFVMISIVSTVGVLAQGVTTGSLGGRVQRKDNGKTIPLSGATVKAVHVPTGATYGAIVRSNGAYTIKGMRTGGPYTVTASFIGYQSQSRTGITIRLGETSTTDFENGIGHGGHRSDDPGCTDDQSQYLRRGKVKSIRQPGSDGR
jgi:hypothetical protein